MRIPFTKKDTSTADAQALLIRLNAKLTETSEAEAASDETIQRLYAENASDAEIARAEEKHLAITNRREHLLDAVTAAEMKLETAKKAEAEALEQKTRVKTGTTIERHITTMTDAQKLFDKGCEAYSRVRCQLPRIFRRARLSSTSPIRHLQRSTPSRPTSSRWRSRTPLPSPLAMRRLDSRPRQHQHRRRNPLRHRPRRMSLLRLLPSLGPTMPATFSLASTGMRCICRTKWRSGRSHAGFA